MLLSRSITAHILEKLHSSQKGIVIYGARQVGKTTLVHEILAQLHLKTFTIDGDQNRYLDILSSRDFTKIKPLLEGYDLLFVDEAQRIPEIGLALKIILDNLPSLKVLVTGSSALNLASKISEPLTGRIWTYHLYPISFLELSKQYTMTELHTMIEERLVFGSYPELFSIAGHVQRLDYLQDLSNAYLYKDLIEFSGIKNSSKIRNLLKLLAFQIGSPVSLSEIGGQLGMSKEIVSRYIDLLEKSYIVFRLSGLSRNLRKEVVKMDKIYFYDTGIRNIFVDNFKPLNDRDDAGHLWENFLIVERMKLLAYTKQYASIYYWRTYTGAELDYVEDKNGTLAGFEFKYGDKMIKVPTGWTKAYPDAEYQCINRTNYLDFILEK